MAQGDAARAPRGGRRERRRHAPPAARLPVRARAVGGGFLNASSLTSKTSFTAITNDKYFSVASSSASSVAFTATDETKLAAGINSVSNVTIAKKMVFELPGFTDLTGRIARQSRLSLDLGLKQAPQDLLHLIRSKVAKHIKLPQDQVVQQRMEKILISTLGILMILLTQTLFTVPL